VTTTIRFNFSKITVFFIFFQKLLNFAPKNLELPELGVLEALSVRFILA